MKTYIAPNATIVEIETSKFIAESITVTINKTAASGAAEEADARGGEMSNGSVWGEEE